MPTRFRSTGRSYRRTLGGFRRGLSGFKRGRTVPNAGTKQVDLLEAKYDSGGAGSIVLLNSLREGPSIYERIGRTVCMKSIYINGVFTRPPAGAQITNQAIIRLMIVYDSQSNGVAPTFANIVQSYNAIANVQSNVTDQLNPDTRDRFKVLCDKIVSLPGSLFAGPVQATTPPWSSLPADVRVQLFCPLKNLETKYSLGVVGIGAIATGSLHMILIDGNNIALNAYNLMASIRLRYCDV